MRQHQVVAPAHLVELARQVEGVHRLAAGPVGLGLDRAHHGADARVEGADGAVRLQLVVLDEVDAGPAERPHELGRGGGVEADGRLDDRADQGGGPKPRRAGASPSTPKRGPG